MIEKIDKVEIDRLAKAVDKILYSEVLERNIEDRLPLVNELADANRIYRGKISVLFVDIRESTKLPEKFNKDQLVKIYRSYIRSVVQAIRYSGGVVKDFMGDGVLAIFVDDDLGKSEDKAVYSARYITTVIDTVLNPKLDENLKYRISCGIGIHTGEVSISKVGMRGKEQDDEIENEFGIAWIGESTNLACKYSGAVNCGTIFISASTYAALSNIDGKQNWSSINICSGKNILNGYVAKHYYLGLDEEKKPCISLDEKEIKSIVEQLKDEYRKHICKIEKQTEDIGIRENNLQIREKELDDKLKNIISRENRNRVKEQELFEQKYSFLKDVIGSGHCQEEYVLHMGKEFWEEHLEKIIEIGAKIGKNEHKVKQEISYAMVSIYKDLQEWDKAYDFLVEQAMGYAWINLLTVQNIVSHVGYCERLKDALLTRVCKRDLTEENQREFEQIRKWLVFEYKK